MISKNWKDKLSIGYIDKYKLEISNKNSFGLLFAELDAEADIYLIPLNEKLQKKDLQPKNYSNLLLLKFDRELIEEDDVEYALDVLNLFNLAVNHGFKIPAELWKELGEILDILKNEYIRNDGSYLIIKSTLKILLLKLIRFQNQHFLDQDLQQKRIYSFLQLMEQNFKQRTNAHFYSELLGISTKRLNQIINKKLGQTANQIIQQRRLTEIKRELQNSNKTIKEIAFEYNFNSAVSFSRFFKRSEGLSALEFRKNNSHKIYNS